ncbi:MAG: altronate hydrolase [Cellvibrio sp. 79]|nr:MAG: altronate hydrolase [Cellvibrio sp. 79]
MNKTTIAPLILLHPDDNILVCVRQIRAGDAIDIEQETIISPIDIGVGHKVARFALAAGDKVCRYGAPIGSMIETVAKGHHVHMHNMKSDYIPSHTRTRQTQYRSEE